MTRQELIDRRDEFFAGANLKGMNDVFWEAIAEIDRRDAALLRIAKWDFDIMGDCVADAQKVARETLKENADG
jgi:hypothetical protein